MQEIIGVVSFRPRFLYFFNSQISAGDNWSSQLRAGNPHLSNLILFDNCFKQVAMYYWKWACLLSNHICCISCSAHCYSILNWKSTYFYSTIFLVPLINWTITLITGRLWNRRTPFRIKLPTLSLMRIKHGNCAVHCDHYKIKSFNKFLVKLIASWQHQIHLSIALMSSSYSVVFWLSLYCAFIYK